MWRGIIPQTEREITYKHEILFIKWIVLDVLDSNILKISEYLKVCKKQVYSHNVSTFKLQFCNSRAEMLHRSEDLVNRSFIILYVAMYLARDGLTEYTNVCYINKYV